MLIGLLLGLMPSRSQATPLYTVSVTDFVAPAPFVRTYDQIQDSLSVLRVSSLNSIFHPTNASFNGYVSPLRVIIQAPGLTADIRAEQNSPALTLTIASMNLTRTFTGKTRADSANSLIAWFQQSGEIRKTRVATSPVDPLAGNPNSLQTRSMNTAFDRGFTRPAAEAEAAFTAGADVAWTPGSSPGPEATTTTSGAAEASPPKATNAMAIGAGYRASLGEYRMTSYTLPLGYRWRLADDFRHQISFDVPITYQTIEGAHGYSLGLGVGYSRPLTSNWVATVGLDYGLAGSSDLGSTGHLLTGTVANLFILPVNRWFLVHLGNMLGYSQTLPLTAGGWTGDPGIKEMILKNGVMLYFSTSRIIRKTGIELFVMDSHFFGSTLYNQNYVEVGTSVGFSDVGFRGRARYQNIFRVGVSALLARGNNGIVVNTGYLF